MIKTDSPMAVTPLTLAVTENWFGELRDKVPGR
jgi:hypothetical protein